MDREFISYSEEGFDDWICNCGNTRDSQGFQPCDSEGNPVEPLVFEEDLYACRCCGRIIKETSLEVVGHTKPKEEALAEF
jgi:hypothetical protein